MFYEQKRNLMNKKQINEQEINIYIFFQVLVS